MTRSEATAIHEATCRALRKLDGVDMPWGEMGQDLAKRVSGLLKETADEISRVRDMASAELDAPPRKNLR